MPCRGERRLLCKMAGGPFGNDHIHLAQFRQDDSQDKGWALITDKSNRHLLLVLVHSIIRSFLDSFHR